MGFLLSNIQLTQLTISSFFLFFGITGLGSILFAITIDRPELNKGYQNLVHVVSSGDVVIPGTGDDEPRPVIAGDSSPVGQSLHLSLCILLHHIC